VRKFRHYATPCVRTCRIYGASSPVHLCNFGHPSLSTPGWLMGGWGSRSPVRSRRSVPKAHAASSSRTRWRAPPGEAWRLPEPNACHKHKPGERGCTGLPACRPRPQPRAAERGAGDNSRDDRDYGRAVRGRRRTCRSVRHRPKPLRDTARTAGNRRRNGAFKEVCTEGLALRIAFLASHLYRSRRLCAE
jgi:hypothetical protein